MPEGGRRRNILPTSPSVPAGRASVPFPLYLLDLGPAMRLLPVVLLALLFASDADAQRLPLDRGTFQVGGSVGYARLGGALHEDVDGSRNSAIVLEPKVAFFLVDRLAVGTALAYENTASDAASSTILTLGPTLSYYLVPAPRTVYPFVTALVGYSHASTDFAVREDLEQEPFEFRSSGVALGAGVGAVVMVTPRVGVTGEGFYQTAIYGSDAVLDTPTADRFGLRLGATVFLF